MIGEYKKGKTAKMVMGNTKQEGKIRQTGKDYENETGN